MKKLIALIAALMVIGLGCAMADSANVITPGTGVQVIPASEWESVYPDEYATYQANSENSETVDYVQEYPYIATIYEGMAFNAYYSSARGHYYTVEDLTSTGRPHKLANCFTCKTADFTTLVNEEGEQAYSYAFEDVQAKVKESVGCYTCHADDPSKGITVTHTYLSNALGSDLGSINAATASCAQCHVEYYFAGENKATTLPYTSLETMTPDAILAFYDETDFADYTNPRTGVRQIKVQHPEFETVMGEGSVHGSMFSCADCHMEKATNEAGASYTSHTWVSPLKSESIQATCAACHSDLAGMVTGIQTKMEERTNAIGTKLETLTNKLAAAVESGSYTEDELNAIRTLNRQGQFYWDFVFVENSEGAHNSKLDNNCLDKAEALVDEALGLFKD